MAEHCEDCQRSVLCPGIKVIDQARQTAVIERAVAEWYSGAWAHGTRVSAADRERLVWTLTTRLGLRTTPAARAEP